MPLTCPRCNSPYHEGSAFCQHCGTPLPGAQPRADATPPGTATPPNVPAQPNSASSYFGAPPPHRLPPATILGMVLGLLAVAAAIAILTSNHGSGAQLANLPLATQRPTLAVPTQPVGTQVVPTHPVGTQVVPTQPVGTAVVPTQALGTAVVPTKAVGTAVVPTQAASTPFPQATQVAATGQTLNTSLFSVNVPSTWQVSNNQASQTYVEVILQDPNHGFIDVFAETSATAQQLLQQALSVKQQAYPDARLCGNSGQDVVGGITGSTELICFTMTPQGGAAQNVQDGVWAGTSASATTGYAVQIIGLASDQQFFNDAASVAGTLQWIGGQ